MIVLHHVWKVYGAGTARVPALADVSFQVAKGEFAVLAGPSGAGKTTLLRLLYLDEAPTEGEIHVAGRLVTGLPRRRIPRLRRALGIVFQDARLLPARSVYDNIAFVLRVLGTPRREITPRVFQSLKAVGLQGRARAFPAQLSQGEQQRVALARALAKDPPLLLADEPTGNLDEEMTQEILEVFKGIWARGTTILLATHRLALAARLGRRTLVLEQGRLVKEEG